jgi:hypothetical protein
VRWVREELGDRFARGVRSAKVQQVCVELGEDGQRSDVSSAGRVMTARRFYGALMVLIPRIGEREQRAGVNQDAHVSRFWFVAAL